MPFSLFSPKGRHSQKLDKLNGDVGSNDSREMSVALLTSWVG